MEPGLQNKSKWIPKGWGGESIIVNKEEYCGKRLMMMKGHCLSVHYHLLKDESFLIIGKVEIRYLNPDQWLWEDGKDPTEYKDVWEFKRKSVILTNGDTFYVPPKMIHQMIAYTDVEIIEFSTQHFDEDSYRVIKGD